MSEFYSYFHHLSTFESNALQSVRFWWMKLRKSQILSWKLQKVSNSGKKFIQNFTWNIYVLQIGHILPSWCFFKGIFSEKNCAFFWDMSWKKSKRVRCWIKRFTTCHNLSWNFPNVSDFDLKNLPRVIIWLSINKKFQTLKWK